MNEVIEVIKKFRWWVCSFIGLAVFIIGVCAFAELPDKVRKVEAKAEKNKADVQQLVASLDKQMAVQQVYIESQKSSAEAIQAQINLLADIAISNKKKEEI